jgi:hypothetical protein
MFDSRQGRIFSLCPIMTGSVSYPASNEMGTGLFYSGVKRPGRETHGLPPINAEAKNGVELYVLSPMHLHSVVLSKQLIKSSFSKLI